MRVLWNMRVGDTKLVYKFHRPNLDFDKTILIMQDNTESNKNVISP